jgi:hypothetical protein
MSSSGGVERFTRSSEAAGFAWDPLFALAAAPSDLKACYLDDPSDPVVLLTWTQMVEEGRQVFYAFTSPDGTVIKGPETLTGNARGVYSQVSILPGEGRDARVAAIYTNSPPEFRVFRVDADTGVGGNDADDDGMNDLVELLIVDFDSGDGLATIDDVLPEADFDGDGFSNLEEALGGSDPTDATSIPNSDGLGVVASADAEEFEAVPGVFVVTRPAEDLSTALQVRYQIGGDATPGSDFVTLPGTVEIPAASTSAQVVVTPLPDALAEGVEQVTLTLLDDPAYTLGEASTASISIRDLPIDQWRLREFGPQAGNPTVAGDLANLDRDALPNILEYALVLDPSLPDGFDVPSLGAWIDPLTGKHYLEITFTEAAEAADLDVIVESSSQLQGWGSGPGHTVDRTAFPAPTDAEGNAIRTIRDAVAREDAPQGRRFLRIRVKRK